MRDILNGYDPKNVSYDAQAAGDCLDRISGKLKCGSSDGTAEVEVCNRVFNGKLKPGATCKSRMESERRRLCVLRSDVGRCAQGLHAGAARRQRAR